MLGGEDGGGDALFERPGFERGRGASARGVAVGGDEEAGGAGVWDEGGEAAGRERGGGGRRAILQARAASPSAIAALKAASRPSGVSCVSIFIARLLS